MLETLEKIYHFLFETFGGIVVLLVSAIIISIIACAIMEVKQRKALKARHEALARQAAEEGDDDWDDDDDEDDDEW